jgi:iron complex transport system ATP-binding protein
MIEAAADLDPSAPLIEIEGASVVRGSRALLDDVSLRLDPGRHAIILGRNGSGKSTLVKLILHQLYPAHGGRVRLFGQDRWNIFELRRLLGFVSPALQSDLSGEEPLEVLDAVVSGFFASRGVWRRETITADMRARSLEALARAGAEALIGRSMATLSTGEARRVLIARALAHRPRALLLDEPCAGLDPAARRRFLDGLRPLARDGTTLILVTHHIEEILPEMDRIIMLQDGRVARDGAKAELLTDAALTDLFGLPMTVTERDGWFSAEVG